MMARGLVLVLVICALSVQLRAQSVEVMPGTRDVFVDMQWLRTFDDTRQVSLFSRTRATVDYENSSNMLLGGYLNYTTTSGFGPTAVATIGSSKATAEAGIHYFTTSPTVVFFGLVSIAAEERFTYSWFSIARFTPALSEHLHSYSSLEVYVQLHDTDLQATVVRARVGLSIDTYQFGFGLNTAVTGSWGNAWTVNPGIFLRKEF